MLIRNSEIDILESVNRQAEIDRIEEEGFKPQTFYSKTYNSKSAKTVLLIIIGLKKWK